MDFTDLDTDPNTAVSKASKAKAESGPRFPCVRCGGSGQYRGYRVNQPATECFSCGGRGYHKQPKHVREAANAKRKATVAQKRTDGIVSFLTDHAKLYEWLHENKHWHGFAGSLAQQLTEKGKLSEKQIEAAYSAMARHAEKEAAKQAAKEQAKADAPKVDISVITALFDHAKESGLKRPKLNAYGVVISEAPAHGVNAGALYVKHNGEYAGKIKAGKFMATNAANEETHRIVNALAADPKGFSAQAGKDTGICCCCSRELTDPVSIEAGIGPICASKWF